MVADDVLQVSEVFLTKGIEVPDAFFTAGTSFPSTQERLSLVLILLTALARSASGDPHSGQLCRYVAKAEYARFQMLFLVVP